MNDSDRWITAEELADFLSMPVASVWRLSRLGQIPSYRLGRLMRFDRAEVREALRGQGHLRESGPLDKGVNAVG